MKQVHRRSGYKQINEQKFADIKMLTARFEDNNMIVSIWENGYKEPLSPQTVDRIRRCATLEAYKLLTKVSKNQKYHDNKAKLSEKAKITIPAAPKLALGVPQGPHRPEVVDAIALKDSIVKLTAAIEKLSTLLDDKNHSTVMRLSPEAAEKSKRFFARNK